MLRVLSMIVLSTLLAGCSGLQLKSDEDAVLKRAEQRMAALQALDFNKAYSYMTPGYRASKNLKRFAGEFAGGANIVSFSVSNPECEQERCTVMVNRKYKMAITARGQTGVKELENNSQQVWIKTDGQWWYYKLN